MAKSCLGLMSDYVPFLFKYEEKYLLSGTISGVSLLTHLNCLRVLGFDQDSQHSAKTWAECHPVYLNFETQSFCKFVNSSTRNAATRNKNILLGNCRVNSSTIITSEEYIWEITTIYSIIIKSNVEQNKKTLLSKEVVMQVKTTEYKAPLPPITDKILKAVEITYLLSKLENNNIVLTIDRSDVKCHTPSRNRDIKTLTKFYKSFNQWITAVRDHFTNLFYHTRTEYDVAKIQNLVNKIPIPFLSLLSCKQILDDNGKINLQVKHQQKLHKILDDVNWLSNPKHFELKLLLVAAHMKKLHQGFLLAMKIIEEQLMAEFVEIVGKKLSSSEFPKIMNFNLCNILQTKYQPKKLCFSIRRGNYHPEGHFHLNKFNKKKQETQPISTFSKKICSGGNVLKIALDTTTKIELTGNKQIHTFFDYQFGDTKDPNLYMEIQSNEFSSFILLVGTMFSATDFRPTHGILLKNKDFVKIPLFLETFPSAKQFKHFTQSLSVEQQEFAKCFRNLQLENSLFAFCIIQIKPPLEGILNLPPSSLHKELQLTKDLLEIFCKYQIPPDLLTFDESMGNQNDPDHIKVFQIRLALDKVLEFIESQKLSKKQVVELIMLEDKRKIEQTLENASETSLLWQKAALEKQEDWDLENIGSPTDFIHHVHIEFDSLNGKFTGMPKEWMMLFKSSGICRQELVDTGAIQVLQFSPVATGPVPPKSIEQELNPKVVQNAVKSPQEAEDKEHPNVDFMSLPHIVEKTLEEFDEFDAVRPTNIKIQQNWELSNHSQLFGGQATSQILGDDQLQNKLKEVQDILDLLTKSALVPIEGDFHILLGLQHNFNKTMMNTITQKNQNPIENATKVSLEVLKVFFATSEVENK